MAKKMAKKTRVPKSEKVAVATVDGVSAVAARVEIRSLILVDSVMSRAPDAVVNQPGSTPEMRIEEVTYNVAAAEDDTGVIVVLPKFSLSLTKGQGEEATQMFSIQARFAVTYAISKISDLDPANFEAFAKTNGVFNAWPYWREFTQSAIARMGLGAYIIPVFRVP
jgi:hypothetical protein